jgi:hypothetical protein
MADERQVKGMEIAAVCKVIRQDDGTWLVPSQFGNGRYVVNTGDDLHCTCPDHETRGSIISILTVRSFLTTTTSVPTWNRRSQ